LRFAGGGRQGRDVTVIVVTGIQAAAKSAIAQALAERLDRSVHLRGDVFRRMIVSGRAEMGPVDPPAQAIAQLLLRYRLAAMAADLYADAGFTVVLQDIISVQTVGESVEEILGRFQAEAEVATAPPGARSG
jgi:predicted kinase